FPALCKAGSPDDVNAISTVALQGIPLIAVNRVPAALPVRMENQYFALDMESAAARDMLEQGICMFYVPALLGQLELELFAVLRS
ncbi:type VI secretion system baseplate subunit TssK, partial [Klebsiella pneumoniae]